MIVSLANLRTSIALVLAASTALVAIAMRDDVVEEVVEEVVEVDPVTLDEEVRRLIDANVEKPSCEPGQLAYPCVEDPGTFGRGWSHCFDYQAYRSNVAAGVAR